MKAYDLLSMDYYEGVRTLIEKYGPVPYAYFCNPSCRSVKAKNSRTSEGLEIHHIDELKYPLLSHPRFALRYDWECQEAENLVYVNVLEHFALHIRICIERGEVLFRPGVIHLAARINDYFNYPDLTGWNKNMYDVIKDSYEEYISILIFQLERALVSRSSYIMALYYLSHNVSGTINGDVLKRLYEHTNPFGVEWSELMVELEIRNGGNPVL